ncbi:MAG TPA: FAD-binding oxidoreductase [Candidatus Binatia bacterium]|nr:FAD-binding oxidoreductase [Candidatus Binatia bacterium]
MESLDRLRATCPSLSLETDPAVRDAAGVDAMRPFRGRPEFAQLRARPLAVAAPASTAEVVALVRWANETGTPLVPRGGGSGLMGGAAVLGRAVVVSFARLDAVAIDPDACAARAGAGASLARVDAAAARHGLMCAHDPWTVGVATVGGALSTAGLGYRGAAAGGIAKQVLALEAVLGDGRIVRSRPVPARSAGLDPTALLVGTEGTAGLVTEATLALVPLPEERVLHGVTLPSFAAVVSFAVALRRTGVRYACLEGSADALPPAPASVMLAFEGLRGEARLHAARAAALARAAGATPLPDAEAEAWWTGRHAIAERWAAQPRFRDGDWLPDGARGHFDYAHVGVPVHALPAVRARAHALVRERGVTLVEEGLWHWPELYSIVVRGGAEDGEGVRATIDGVCRAAQDAGGTMEYCHGVGWKLAHLMEAEHGADGLAVIRRLEAALDPARVLNPAKAGT